MRFFHESSKRIHSVAGLTNLQFTTIDFGINTKALLPTVISLRDVPSDSTPKFICAECEEKLEIENLQTKCTTCGKLFPVTELYLLSRTGVVVCKADIEKTKDDKETTKLLSTIMQSISIK